jgi:hypothetical protein
VRQQDYTPTYRKTRKEVNAKRAQVRENEVQVRGNDVQVREKGVQALYEQGNRRNAT